MKNRSIISILVLSVVALAAAACGAKSGSSAKETVIKSTKAGNLTITLASESGEIKSGDNDLLLSFTDSSGKMVDVGAASLKLHMPAMGAMAEMNDVAALTTTETPGKYRAKVNVEVRGTWEAIVVYEGPNGNGKGSMTVNAK